MARRFPCAVARAEPDAVIPLLGGEILVDERTPETWNGEGLECVRAQENTDEALGVFASGTGVLSSRRRMLR